MCTDTTLVPSQSKMSTFFVITVCKNELRNVIVGFRTGAKVYINTEDGKYECRESSRRIVGHISCQCFTLSTIVVSYQGELLKDTFIDLNCLCHNNVNTYYSNDLNCIVIITIIISI